MNSKTIEYFDGNEKLIGELIGDKQQGPQPALVLFSAFEGRGSFAIDYAKKLAEHGFLVLVADMYGEARIANTIDGCYKLVKPFLENRELVRRRSLLAFETLKQQKNVNKNKIGALGFCFGGMCALEIARSGVDLKAVVSLHGVLSKSNLETHPIKSKILSLAGYKDPQVPPQQIENFEKEMEQAHVKDWTLIFFGDAKHSFTDPKTGTFDPAKEKEMGREYNKIAAERSFRYTVDFFHEILRDS